MFSVIASFGSSIYCSICRITYNAITLLRQAFGSQGNRFKALATKGTNDFNGPSGYADTCLTIQYQTGLDIIGVGAAGQVYDVDEQIVLKTCRIYEPPSSNAAPRVLWDYASETVFHSGLLKDERVILRLLASRPHPNIIEVIDADQPEGIYLRKYQQLSELTSPSQSDRILWYQDILRALLHLHTLGLAHSDIRKDNVLFDGSGRALLSDLGATCSFGGPNPSLPLLTNGTSKTVSDATDRFAMASMMYEWETEALPNISTDNGKCLLFPPIHTGNAGLDSLIENAWRGRFESTAEMLEHADQLLDGSGMRKPPVYLATRGSLRERISSWRAARLNRYGCVLFALPTETQINTLAEQYGWHPNDERHFPDDTVHHPANMFPQSS